MRLVEIVGCIECPRRHKETCQREGRGIPIAVISRGKVPAWCPLPEVRRYES